MPHSIVVHSFSEKELPMTTAAINNAESIPVASSPGRPPGSRNKSKQLLDAIIAEDPDAPAEIAKVLVAAARAGKPWAVEAVASRLWPAPKGRLIEFDLPPVRRPEDISLALDAILQAVAGGILTPDEGAALSSTVIDGAAKVMHDVQVYLATVAKLAAAGDKRLSQLPAPYPVDD
jgi:hypothetical protein